MSEYNIVKPEQKLKVAQPKYLIFSNLDAVYRMVADIAVYKAFQEHQVAPDTLIIQVAPRKRLVATTAITSLTLVPWSHTVQAEAVETKKDQVLYVEVATKPPKVFAISAPNDLGKKIELEFWRMAWERKDEKNANMTLGSVKVNVDWPFDIGFGKSVTVIVPVAKSKKQIKPEEEIRLLSLAPAKKRKAMEISLSDFGDQAKK